MQCVCVGGGAFVKHLLHTYLPFLGRTPESPSQAGVLREELLRRALGVRLT